MKFKAAMFINDKKSLSHKYLSFIAQQNRQCVTFCFPGKCVYF